MSSPRSSVLAYLPFLTTVGVGSVCVAITIFSDSLIILVGGFSALVWALVLIALFVCFLAWAAVHAVIRVRRDGLRAGLPLCVGGVSLVCILVISSSDIPRNTDFSLNRAQREAVVAQIRAGTLKPNVSYNPDLISLPFPYVYLSEGGEISVYKVGRVLTIYFYTWRGVLDNFTTYIYQSNADDLTAHSVNGLVLLNGDRFSSMQRLASHWYWAVSS